MRPVVVMAWLAVACGFKINQMGSDLRAVGFDVLGVVVFSADLIVVANV